MKPIIAAMFGLALATSAQAGEVTTYPFAGSFDDATFAVENAIIDRGLVIDYVSKIGDMLNRTGADVGSDVKLFDAANAYLFCSAVLSRKMMEADPLNVAHCPYAVFVIDRDGAVEIGYRTQSEGVMQDVQSLLDDIAREAAEQ